VLSLVLSWYCFTDCHRDRARDEGVKGWVSPREAARGSLLVASSSSRACSSSDW
jgi:hypothetical protein